MSTGCWPLRQPKWDGLLQLMVLTVALTATSATTSCQRHPLYRDLISSPAIVACTNSAEYTSPLSLLVPFSAATTATSNTNSTTFPVPSLCHQIICIHVIETLARVSPDCILSQDSSGRTRHRNQFNHVTYLQRDFLPPLREYCAHPQMVVSTKTKIRHLQEEENDHGSLLDETVAEGEFESPDKPPPRGTDKGPVPEPEQTHRGDRPLPPPALGTIEDPSVKDIEGATSSGSGHQLDISEKDHHLLSTVIVAAALVIVLMALFVVYHWYKRLPAKGGVIDQGMLALELPRHRDRDRDPEHHCKTSSASSSASTTNLSSDQSSTSDSPSAALWGDQDLLAWHMRIEDLQDVRVIGSGGYGIVYLVKFRASRLLASKRLVSDQRTTDKTNAFIAEIKLVATLQHPCIVEFVGAAWTTVADLQALFEYMSNGDLRTHLETTSATMPNTSEVDDTWDQSRLAIAMDVVEALVYVHSFRPPLLHRDLKSRNVLLTSDMRAKLGDFGVSRYESSNQTMTTGVGTSRWLAPEVMNGGGEYGQACDIYSLGVLLSELDTHALPYSDLRTADGHPMPEVALLQQICQGKLQPSFAPTCPESIRRIAERCLSFHAKDRPSAIQVAYMLRTAAKVEYHL